MKPSATSPRSDQDRSPKTTNLSVGKRLTDKTQVPSRFLLQISGNQVGARREMKADICAYGALQAASGWECSATIASTSGAYLEMKPGPTPLIAIRASASVGRAAAIEVSVRLLATV
jgi:hypothetical protein